MMLLGFDKPSLSGTLLDMEPTWEVSSPEGNHHLQSHQSWWVSGTADGFVTLRLDWPQRMDSETHMARGDSCAT